MKRIILLFIYIFILCGCTFTPTVNNGNGDEPTDIPDLEEPKDFPNQENPDDIPPVNPDDIPPVKPDDIPPVNPDEWDDLGGGGNGEQTEENEITIDGIPVNKYVESLTYENFKLDQEVIFINLNNLSTTNDYTYKDNILTISNDGVYELQGTLNGALIVNGDADNIIVRLNNVTIKTLDEQPYPAITFKKHSGVRVLEIVENSKNYLSDSIGDTNEADEGCAVIQAKKSNLIIGGSGELNLKSYGEETTGIKVKKDLFIFDVTINIDVNDNGIKSGSTMGIYNANITIKSLNDGIKTDVEAESLDDEVVNDLYAGFMYIKNSNITIEVSDNGIDANSYLKINNSIDYTIKVITNGGAPSTITENSSDNADGKAIRASGIKYVDPDTEEETDLLSKTEFNYLLVILGGNFIINSNDDAITSKGNLIIFDGNYNISTGDDAIHAEYITTIHDGIYKVNKCYEAIEGASVEIYGGEFDLTSVDDGINAANGDLTNYPYNIYIGGGNILLNVEGDGIDSNGTVEIAGGTIIINGPSRNDNAALDADRGILVNGGNLIAVGPMGMIETPGNNSKQCSIVIGSSQAANTLIQIKDQNNNVIFETTAAKSFQSIVISLEAFEIGSTYTIIVGSSTNTVTLSSILTNIGNSGNTGPGGRPPGGGGRPPR